MYHFTKQGIITENYIKNILILLTATTIISFFRQEQEMIQKAVELDTSQDEFTNNVGYDFLQLMPLLFFWRKTPLLQTILLLIILTFIILGMKRGAILIAVICTLYFFIQSFRNASRRTKFLIIILAICTTFAMTVYISEEYATSSYFQYRVEQTLEGGSSGRNQLYSALYYYYFNQENLLSILFGNGMDYTVAIAGNFAHNDWLELAINQGLLGVILYIWYFVSFIHTAMHTNHRSAAYGIMVMALMIMFTSSIFSMSYGSLNLSIAIGLGYAMTHYRNQTKQSNS